MALAEAVYLLTRSFPPDERFGLTSQARRAAASVPANIAEGYGRGTRPAYISFVNISQGSLKELETHLMLAARVGACRPDDISGMLDEADQLGRMLRALAQSLRSKQSP
jgi:four helix bundle protein